MPIQLVHINPKKNMPLLALWRATESTEELISLLPESLGNSAEYAEFTLEKRRREWLTTRLLLNEVVPGMTLGFLQNGKPVLSGGGHISISHSDNLAGVIHHEVPVGLDIQAADEKLFRIRTRFCHISELEITPSENTEDFLAMIWSAKEAVFKRFGEGVTFASDMILRPFEVGDEILHLDYQGRHGRQTFELSHMVLDGYHIVNTI